MRRVRHRADRPNQDLAMLNALAEALSASNDLELLLENALKIALDLVRFDGWAIFVNDWQEESMCLLAHRGISQEAVRVLDNLALGEGITGRVAVTGETIAVDDSGRDSRILHPGLSAQGIRSCVAIPLPARGEVIGVLDLFSTQRHRFTSREVKLLTFLGRQLGPAVENLRLCDRLAAAREEWRVAFDSLTDGISIHSTSGKIRLANRHLAEIKGTALDDLVGKRCCQVFYNSPKPRPDCLVMEAVTRREHLSIEIEDEENERILRITASPIINRQNRVVGVVCTTRDITEQKAIERRMIQNERISAIGELAAGIAHEIGTPLNIISANVEYLLIDKPAGSPGYTELQAIREQVLYIAKLVRNLLDLSRESRSKFEAVDFNAIVAKTLSLLQHQIERSGIRVETKLAQYLPMVDGDPQQLQQVLFNLITNACQAMPQGGRLAISTDSQLDVPNILGRPAIIVKISDTGVGILKQDLPKIFNAFYTNKEKGTGLGLTLTHKIIQNHNGVIQVDSEAGLGTTFTIYLPVSQA